MDTLTNINFFYMLGLAQKNSIEYANDYIKDFLGELVFRENYPKIVELLYNIKKYNYEKGIYLCILETLFSSKDKIKNYNDFAYFCKKQGYLTSEESKRYEVTNRTK